MNIKQKHFNIIILSVLLILVITIGVLVWILLNPNLAQQSIITGSRGTSNSVASAPSSGPPSSLPSRTGTGNSEEFFVVGTATAFNGDTNTITLNGSSKDKKRTITLTKGMSIETAQGVSDSEIDNLLQGSFQNTRVRFRCLPAGDNSSSSEQSEGEPNDESDSDESENTKCDPQQMTILKDKASS